MADSSNKMTKRKAELLVQSALLREKLAVETLSLFQMPDIVSKGLGFLSGFNKIKKNPLVIAPVILTLLVLRPRRIISWAVSATVLFKTWHRFKPVLTFVLGFLARRKK